MVAATAARERTSSLPKMFATWVSTVLVERCSWAAMRRLVWPSASRSAISRSRSVSAPTPASGRRAARALAGDAAAEPAQLARGLVVEAARAGLREDGLARRVSATVASRWWPPAASAWPASSCARRRVERGCPTRCASRAAIRAARGGAGAVARREQDGGAGAQRLARAGGQAEAGRGHLGVGGVAVGLGEAAGGQLGAGQDLVPARLERALDELQLGLQQLDGRCRGRRPRGAPRPGSRR